jgi:branched-chain amino acid aminotransferase
MTHDFVPDPRNDSILVWIDGQLVPRAQARVSVFDSGFLMGDGVWEGLRVHDGRVPFLDRHLDRLEENAKAIALELGRSREALVEALRETLQANVMRDGGHVRLMVTRGPKSTPYQDPRVAAGPPTTVIIAEHKAADPAPLEKGLRLFTVHVRRGRPDVQDPRWNSHSKLNCITACIQAAQAGADEALMLDPQGFVATCNSTNFFVVRRGEVWTSTPKYCMNGITRAVTLELCRDHGIPARETDFPLTDVYSADEAFVTGTFGGQVPVVDVDGRRIGDGRPGPLTARLRELYRERAGSDGPRLVDA